MFFLFENNNPSFYQIFTNVTNNITSDDSIIYKLESNINSSILNEINQHKIKKEFKICVSGNNITFIDLDNNNINNFIFTTELNEQENINNIMIFKNKYKKLENIPLFIDNDYEQIFYSSFQITEINNNLFFIQQFDKKTFKTTYFYVSQHIDQHLLKKLSDN